MHVLTWSVLDVMNNFYNTNVPVEEIVWIKPLPYYLDCFDKSYPKLPLNRDNGTFYLQFMNITQGT